MRILDSNEYINEKLDIKPVTKDMLSKFREEPSVDEKTRQFIEDNNLKWNPVTKSYDCGGDVKVSEDIVAEGKLKIRFGKVGGEFDCGNNNLTTLDGAPQYVGGSFYCYGNKLTTLKGAPQEISKDFDCGNNNLTTLEGAPKYVGDNFICSYNKLTTLEGAPQEVGGGFYCTSNKLASLECAPNKVGGYFYCSDNPNLVLPKGKPSWLKGNFIN